LRQDTLKLLHIARTKGDEEWLQKYTEVRLQYKSLIKERKKREEKEEHKIILRAEEEPLSITRTKTSLYSSTQH
jgi:hypothetical protein